jgi:hypothetical protein
MGRIQKEAEASPKEMEKSTELEVDNTDISGVEIDLDLTDIVV